jgi:hypothetical protein
MDKNYKDFEGILKKIIYEIELNRKDFEDRSIDYDEYKKNIDKFIYIMKNMYEKT